MKFNQIHYEIQVLKQDTSIIQKFDEFWVEDQNEKLI